MDKFFVKSHKTAILDLLPSGSIKLLAEETGIDRNNIRRILKGEWTNEDVVRRALAILEAHKIKIEEILELAAA